MIYVHVATLFTEMYIISKDILNLNMVQKTVTDKLTSAHRNLELLLHFHYSISAHAWQTQNSMKNNAGLSWSVQHGYQYIPVDGGIREDLVCSLCLVPQLMNWAFQMCGSERRGLKSRMLNKQHHCTEAIPDKIAHNEHKEGSKAK